MTKNTVFKNKQNKRNQMKSSNGYVWHGSERKTL